MINILMSGNSKVFDGVLTLMLSIFKRNKIKDEIFNFYIFTADCTYLKEEYTPISDNMIEFLDGVAKSYNKENKVIKYDVTEYYNQEFKGSPNELCYCSPFTLLRLLLDLIPNMPSKLLYLDVDIMFNNDIHLLYDVDIKGYEYAAARDQYGKFLVNPNYINAGVLLFNVDEIKKTKLLTKARALIRKKHLPFADQSAIIRSTTKRKLLEQKFNCQGMLTKKTVVRHFAKRLYFTPYIHVDNIKQWNVEKVHKVLKYHQFDDIYEEYFKLKKEFEVSYGK